MKKFRILVEFILNFKLILFTFSDLILSVKKSVKTKFFPVFSSPDYQSNNLQSHITPHMIHDVFIIAICIIPPSLSVLAHGQKRMIPPAVTLELECVIENYLSYFSSKTYVVGTQKNRLNETVLLSTQNTCLNGWLR